jgi:uncharacterized protein YggE
MKKWFLLMSLGLLILSSQNGCYADEFDNLPKLLVKGEASIFKPADQMEVSLGVLTTGDNSSQAVESNNQKMRQVIANLKSLGLDETDYQTRGFQVKPVYQKPSKESEKSNQGKIDHYEAFNTIQIKTQKITLADQIISAAIQGGANHIPQVNFNLNNPQAYREGAIKLAAQNALSDANALAAATAVKLKRILNLSLDQWQSNPQPLMLKAKGGAAALSQEERQSTMEPGQVEIHAVVNITMEIEG